MNLACVFLDIPVCTNGHMKGTHEPSMCYLEIPVCTNGVENILDYHAYVVGSVVFVFELIR